MSKFSERFAKLKDASGKTLKELSSERELAISISNLSYYMNGREPNFDTLCKIAEYFGVSTDYLIGKTDHMTIEDEFADKIINNDGKENITYNSKRIEQVKNYSTKLYHELTLAADDELLANKDVVWNIVGEFLTSISYYREFLKEYKYYPLDPALKALNGFERVGLIAFSPVNEMLESLIHDQNADEALKKRVGIKMPYAIKSEFN